MSVLSNGPFSYNRFDGVNVGDSVNSAYHAIYEKKAKPDFLDMDKDGNKKESFKKAVDDKKKGCSKCEGDCECDDKKDVKENHEQLDELAPLAALAPLAGKAAAGLAGKGATALAGKAGGSIAKAAGSKLGKKAISAGSQAIGNKVTSSLSKSKNEEVTKDDVIKYLMDEGFANNPVSAEVLFNHMSDQWLESIEEGFMPLPKDKMERQANKAYGKEQQAVRAGDEKETNKQMQRRIAMKDPSGRKVALGKG